MQVHMRRLVEVTKDIDGFKERSLLLSIMQHNNGGLYNGRRKENLQKDDC